MNELLDYLIVEKEIVEKLIEIDNDKMNSKIIKITANHIFLHFINSL